MINAVKGKRWDYQLREDYDGPELESAQNERLNLEASDEFLTAATRACWDYIKKTDWAYKTEKWESQHNKYIRHMISLIDSVSPSDKKLIEFVFEVRYVKGGTYEIVGGKLVSDPEPGLKYPASSGDLVKNYFKNKK